MKYIALLHQDADSDIVVSFPDFPGVVGHARNLPKAHAMAHQALRAHLANLRVLGRRLPEPSTLAEFASRSITRTR
jgi:predicted RNase H-like HicB family nuclease